MAENKPESRAGSSFKLSKKQPREIAAEAYIYGYPLVLMDVTRQVATNVPRPTQDAAPLNQLGNKRSFPDANFTTVVSPNADTLYTFAYLDVSREPRVLSVPEMGKRYYLMQMLDAWTNVFASVGTRTSGNGKGDFAITGPNWHGSLPDEVEEINSPTNLVWIIGRTQTNGKSDYTAVHTIQDRYHLRPLSSFGKLYKLPGDAPVDPNLDMKTSPVAQVAWMSAEAFFNRLNALMKTNPPSHDDGPALKRFESIGVAPGRPFALEKLETSLAKDVKDSVREARTRLLAEARKPHGKNVNGWEFITNIGRYGTDYLWRALVAHIGLGANLPEDAIYPRATTDANGRPLTGANRYEIHFQPGHLPPVNAFWSITMYNERQFFVSNAINRYAIGDRDQLKFESDGSLKLYIQNEPPVSDKESNWLPAPPDSFNLMMRLYWPREAIIESLWKPPRIELKEAKVRRIA